MIHRKNIIMLDAEQSADSIIRKAMASPHTRIPLYRGDQEEIVGILHVKDLLRAIMGHDGKTEGLDLVEISRDPWFVPETTSG